MSPLCLVRLPGSSLLLYTGKGSCSNFPLSFWVPLRAHISALDLPPPCLTPVHFHDLSASNLHLFNKTLEARACAALALWGNLVTSPASLFTQRFLSSNSVLFLVKITAEPVYLENSQLPPSPLFLWDGRGHCRLEAKACPEKLPHLTSETT